MGVGAHLFSFMVPELLDVRLSGPTRTMRIGVGSVAAQLGVSHGSRPARGRLVAGRGPSACAIGPVVAGATGAGAAAGRRADGVEGADAGGR
ncbi:hypothetical protein, partial [uncultured Actinomyces sp.]|uniref:hypothetical protein n=1 Tax=uncultured Actinomyces sp. TaxID=249061 RepID=UPI0028D367AF